MYLESLIFGIIVVAGWGWYLYRKTHPYILNKNTGEIHSTQYCSKLRYVKWKNTKRISYSKALRLHSERHGNGCSNCFKELDTDTRTTSKTAENARKGI